MGRGDCGTWQLVGGVGKMGLQGPKLPGRVLNMQVAEEEWMAVWRSVSPPLNPTGEKMFLEAN